MKNPAQTNHPILTELTERWSPVIFSERAVEADKLERMLEAARWAASSGNEQPWSFVVAHKSEPESFERLAACLLPGNAWAKSAPMLMLSVARMVRAGSTEGNRYAFHDLGMAMGNLLAQATADGLFVHQMGGFDVEKARKDVGVPENHEPGAMIALGYYGDQESADQALRDREKRPRVRKNMDEFVFRGLWGKLS